MTTLERIEAPFGLNLEHHESRENWLAARKTGVGGSDAPIVLGLSTFKTALALWAEKRGLAPDSEINEAMLWGTKLEGVIADHYTEATGRKVVSLGQHTIVRNNERPWQIATLDRVIVTDGSDALELSGNYGVLEVKTAGAHQSAKWEEGCPEPYYAQVQHQLAVTGFGWGSICVLLGGQQFRWMDIERDDAFIAEMNRVEERFWHQVEHDEEPTAQAEDSKLLGKLYPDADPDLTLNLAMDAVEWDEERLRASNEIAYWQAIKDANEARIKQAMGTAETAVLPSGTIYTWKSQTKAEHVVKESTFRVLRRREPK